VVGPALFLFGAAGGYISILDSHQAAQHVHVRHR
jgi:hypothetical protein